MKIVLTHRLLLVLLMVASIAAVASAEIPNLSSTDMQKAATQIVTGKLQKIYSVVEQTSDDWRTTFNVAEVRVDKIEKGDPKGALLYARFWRKQYIGKDQAPPGHYGHRGVPNVGQEIRVFVKKAEDGGYDVLSPNGFEVLKRSAR